MECLAWQGIAVRSMDIVGVRLRIVGRDVRLRLRFVVEEVWGGDEEER
jgi:hypothetical protein